MRRARYTREEIAQAALDIADAEGFEALSMRRLARELGAGTMTLYHYVSSKHELIDLLDDAIMGELLIPDDELPADWREALAEIARRTRAVFARHPWAVEALRGAQGGPNGLRHFEQSLTAVAGTGLDLETRLEILLLVDDYAFGTAMREVMIAAEMEAHAEQWPPEAVEYFTDLLQSGAFPHVEEITEGGDAQVLLDRMTALHSDDQRFERGLQRLLDGIALEVDRRRS